MKNKKFLFISLLILAIGFAAVSTTLYISGNLLFGTNKNDLEVYFSGAIIDNEDKSNEVILSDKKHIEYETKELKTLGDTSVLEFEVTNNSTQYDAKVSISCTLSDNEYITYTTDKQEYEIPAQTRNSGKVTVELIKVSTNTLNPTISCELVSTAEERTSGAETVITDTLYEMTGSLTDEEGNILANKNLVVYSETPHYVTTDDYGFFYVSGLEKGSHEIYYVNEENVEGKTKEEVKELAKSEAKITTNSTSINFNNLKLNDFKINVEKKEEINITLDADSGSIDSNTIKLNKYQKGSELPTPTPKNSNYEFLGWYDGDKKITNNTIITREMNLVAKWNILIVESNGENINNWFLYENYQIYDKSEVLNDSEKLNKLMNNENAYNYLLSNETLISELKEDENYDSTIVPIMLNKAKTSNSINQEMYEAKLPAYIYNYGTYYLLTSMKYVSPSNSCQTIFTSNTSSNGLYFYMNGTTSASQSIGLHYSNQNINPYKYSNIVINSNFSTNLSYDYSTISLCNGSASSEKWAASFSGCINSVNLPTGENKVYMSVNTGNHNYRIVLQQLVNKYQVSGNYYNATYIRSIWLQ